MLGVVYSINNVPIRLNQERWIHIVESHDYMVGLYEWVLDAIASPNKVVLCQDGSYIATQKRMHTPIGPKDMVVVYRETNSDGFIITAFMTSKVETVWRRGSELWSQT